jgi:pilus assembly protein Flp/PilA
VIPVRNEQEYFMRPTLTQILRRFFGNESGTTAIEYALIASGVSIVIMVSVMATGTSLKTMYQTVSDSFK